MRAVLLLGVIQDDLKGLQIRMYVCNDRVLHPCA
jgi:hypothetical protein